MARPLLRRTALVLLAALLLALPAAAAPAVGKGQSGATILTSIWDFFVSLLKAGCGIDPNGGTAAAPQEAGCGLDPNGCAASKSPPPADHADEGCGLDPNGGCAK
jgi:hypothetical protein